MRPGTVYAMVSVETSFLLGTHFFCNDTMGRTLHALIHAAPAAATGQHAVGYKTYDKAVIAIFKLLHAWLTTIETLLATEENTSTPYTLPSIQCACYVLIIVENADRLVQHTLSSSPEFSSDLARARRLVRRFWDIIRNDEDVYPELKLVEESLQRHLVRLYIPKNKLRYLSGSLRPID